MIIEEIKAELAAASSPANAANLQRFFKTGPGEYAEGDLFLGVTVPIQRSVVAKYWKAIALEDIGHLLRSPVHEHRLTALLMLVSKYQKNSSPALRAEIFALYDASTDFCNNWDLVDSSAHHIAGAYASEFGSDFLLEMACCTSLWRNRIAMVATYYFIKKGKIEPVFDVARLLLSHKHDLIHKATGWMLREAGKVNKQAVYAFLREYYAEIPRTALRYAIEKYPDAERKKVLAGEFVY